MGDKNINKWVLVSISMALLGFCFTLLFQWMAYWGGVTNGIANTELWYWVGAGLAYAFSILSMVFLFLRFRRRNKEYPLINVEMILEILSSVFVVINILLTTFLIIAGQSGF